MEEQERKEKRSFQFLSHSRFFPFLSRHISSITHPGLGIQMANSSALGCITGEKFGWGWSSDLGRVDAKKKKKDGRKQRGCWSIILIGRSQHAVHQSVI